MKVLAYYKYDCMGAQATCIIAKPDRKLTLSKKSWTVAVA